MRRKTCLSYAGFALGAALFLLSGFASAQNLVLNPSFETLGQANWTAVISGPAVWVDSGATPPTTNGANGLTSNQGGPSSQILYQDIVLPATGLYAFSIDAGCNPQGLANTDFCRVDITNTNAATLVPPTPGADTLATTGANVLVPVYSRDGVAGNDPQAPRSVTFSGTAGQTVRVRLLVQASNFFANIFADNMALGSAIVAVVPTLSELAMIMLSALLAVFGLYYIRREGLARIG